MTRWRTAGRQGGFAICPRCAKREHLRIGGQGAADVPCYWCGTREASTMIELEDDTINGKILVLIGVGATSRSIAERLCLSSASAVRKRVERLRRSQVRG